MMVRMETVTEVGLMDEGYRMYCEEIDWCWRMRRAGWGALCAPSARVIHHAGQSTAQVPISSFVNLWTSRARLYARHHGLLGECRVEPPREASGRCVRSHCPMIRIQPLETHPQREKQAVSGVLTAFITR